MHNSSGVFALIPSVSPCVTLLMQVVMSNIRYCGNTGDKSKHINSGDVGSRVKCSNRNKNGKLILQNRYKFAWVFK